jgi:signal transduction histidine kinase
MNTPTPAVDGDHDPLRYVALLARRRASVSAAVALVAIGVGLAVFGVWWSLSSRSVLVPPGVEAGPGAAFFLGTVPFVLAGGVVAVERRRNPIGWILLLSGVTWQLYGVAGVHRVVLGAGGSSPVAAWLWEVLWIPGICVVPALFLLFPDGRLPSRRWRVLAVWLGIAVGSLLLAVGLRPGPLTATPIDNPLGLDVLADVSPALEAVGNLGFALGTLAAFAASWVRYRRGGRTERYQLKWFLSAAVIVVAGLSLGNVLEAAGASSEVTGLVRGAPLVALPVAVAAAVLRHRLYGIDVVITRAVVYAGLAASVTLVYATMVVGVGSLVGARADANLQLTVAATAVAALAFQPARVRLQRVANRLVYGQRASPYEVLASFTRQMTGTPATIGAPTAIARAVTGSLEVSSCEVWLRDRDELRPAGRWPDGGHASPAVELPTAGGPLRLPGTDRAYPVRHDEVLLGAIGVTLPAGGSLTSTEDRLLEDLAAAAWLVLDNSRLLADLRTSRQRLVAAQDTQRRRTERDLHDGAQQRLLELALTLTVARQHADQLGDGPTVSTIAAAELQLRAALSELRDLARGLHPAILTDRGLVAALESLAERAPLAVTVAASPLGRLSTTCETTAYFVAAEALANIVKHAGAASASIVVTVQGTCLRLVVDDDGCGGADPSRPGLRGLADRVGALDGRLEVVSPAGSGTRLVAELPCA